MPHSPDWLEQAETDTQRLALSHSAYPLPSVSVNWTVAAGRSAALLRQARGGGV
jgi:hypothetical protein